MAWFIWSNEHAQWWGPGGVGYTRVIEDAGRYTMADAIAVVMKSSVDGRHYIKRESRTGQPMQVAPEVMVPAFTVSPREVIDSGLPKVY